MENQQARPLVVENISKSLGGKKIIKDLSFSVEAGKIYGFLGPNGSGKTTTIRMIVSLIGLDAGDVKIGGHSIRTEREQALSQIGAIVENPDLYEYMSGRKNLIHFARMTNKKVTTERIDEVIKMVELDHAIDKKVKTYSLGMKQRLGIALSILHEPSVLILDEPTNGLDPKGIRELRSYLKDLAHNSGVAILVSSHLLSEIELMCDRAIVIKEGQVINELAVNDKEQGEEQEVAAVFEVNQLEKAEALLLQYGTVRKEENRIILENTTVEQVPSIVSALVKQEIDIYHVSYKKSLEDTYHLLTEKEVI
ncbi:ABC transporter ATP-binding protein [Alkalicoccobacillus plakortidis]|uniref:ABC transporter ATP-binding protein n=1 Tax=Alkalicoccobacillus plakortidis TaxID=444060 RepID=A0ABT0XJ48_9BACI|nr:ABC transporter ATP-binding protein [Alkalicoccobacillus plakortidis]MCM2675936.1 ABC transporter ATP-binding protein [Alkalicoccobacillus plakortidis]